jgi:arylsulfatase A-like enzyme
MGAVPTRAHRAAASGLLLAATALGCADALLASWHNRAIAPHATLPLCLTAPFPTALVVLLPGALLLATLARGPLDARSSAAALLAVACGAGALRGVAAVGYGWREAGEADLAAALDVVAWAAAAAMAFVAWRLARPALERLSARRMARLVRGAALVHALALYGLVRVIEREDRGAVREAIASSLGLEARAAAAPRASPAGREPHAAAAPPRHLVLVTIDTLRADHLDAEHMPYTSALAADGVRFRDAHAAAPWTLPSVASLLTGLPAAVHGAGQPLGEGPLARSALATEHATIATELAAAGFETRAVVTNPYLGLGYGLGRGFAAFENVTLESEAALTLRSTLGFWLLTRALPQLAVSDRGGAVTSRAARFLRARRSDGRLFLWLHYVDPHAPYDGATRSFRDDLLAGPAGTLPRMAQLRAGEIRPDAAGRRRLREAYARAVRAVDREVGAVVRLLDEAGMAEEALLVVTSDHGEELWDHGGVEHGHTLFAELTRVPLVLRCPGCPRGREVTELVGLDGLAATLLELLGVAPRPAPGSHAPAMSPGFARLVRGEGHEPRPVVSENLLFAAERVALRTSRFTYVAWPNGKEELYDRRRDPAELHDLAARRRLVRHHRERLAAARGQTPPTSRSGGDDPSECTRRALQALGYVR